MKNLAGRNFREPVEQRFLWVANNLIICTTCHTRANLKLQRYYCSLRSSSVVNKEAIPNYQVEKEKHGRDFWNMCINLDAIGGKIYMRLFCFFI